jgi:hypothetical protein
MVQVRKRAPENVAAVVNASLVLALPVAFAVALWIGLGFDTDRVTVTPYSEAWLALVNVLQMGVFLVLISPLALLAGWRTWVHARRYREGSGTGWQGVIEAGAVGVAIAFWILAGPIAMHPVQAPPYVMFYGGAALILGLIIGLVLRMTAILVLKLQGSSLHATKS